MGKFMVETFIARPPDEVFAYLRDVSNQKVWQAENVVEVTVEPPGRANVGTRFHKVRRTPMGEQRFTEEVTELDETARRFADNTISGSLRGTKGTWEVQPEEMDRGCAAQWRCTAPVYSDCCCRWSLGQRNKTLESEFANLKNSKSAPL